MRTVAIIQARMGSTRLPNKALLELGGWPMLAWSIERARRFPFVDDLCVATSGDPEDDAISDLCEELDAVCVRHSQKLIDGRNDVLARFCKAAEWMKADCIVRITGDCPFVSACLATQVFEGFMRNGKAYAGNITPALDGFDIEIFKRDALFMADRLVVDMDERHHVTLSMRRHSEHWLYLHQPWVHGRKLSIDTPTDYLRARQIVRELAQQGNHEWAEWPAIIKEADRLTLQEEA